MLEWRAIKLRIWFDAFSWIFSVGSVRFASLHTDSHFTVSKINESVNMCYFNARMESYQTAYLVNLTHLLA